MRNPIVQLILLIALSGAAGAAYNFSNAKNSQKYILWDGGRIYGKNATNVTAAQDGVVVPGKTSPTVTTPPPTGAKDPPGLAPTETPSPPKNPGDKPDSPPATTPASPFPLINLKQALEELDGGTTFVDARRTREYEEGHIPGAISICPYEQGDLLDKVNKLREGAVLEAPVVVYCTNAGECESSKLTAAQLKEAGFLNLLIYQGGFPEWKKEKADKIAVGKEPGKWAP